MMAVPDDFELNRHFKCYRKSFGLRKIPTNILSACLQPYAIDQDLCYTLLKRQDRIGGTVLHYAAYRNQAETIRCLLNCLTPDQCYALVMEQDIDGKTALHYTISMDHKLSTRYLTDCLRPDQYAALLNVLDRKGQRAEYQPISSIYMDTIRAVLQSADILHPQVDAFHVREGAGDTAKIDFPLEISAEPQKFEKKGIALPAAVSPNSKTHNGMNIA